MLSMIIIGCADNGTGPTSTGSVETLFFTRHDPATNTDDVVRWRDGMSQPELLFANAEVSGPPAKGKIVVTQWDGTRSQVIMANEDGTDQRVLLTMDTRIRTAALSPDAAYVAYTFHTRIDDQFVYSAEIMPVHGGTAINVAPITAWENPVQWSPTQNVLAFLVPGSEHDSLMVLNADGTGRRLVSLDVEAANDGFYTWRWTNDGRAILNAGRSELAFQVVEYDVLSGTPTSIFESTEQIVLNAAGSRKDVGTYYLSLVTMSSTPSTSQSTVALLPGTTSPIQTLLQPLVGILAFYVNASRDDAYLSYVEVDLTSSGTADPVLDQSRVKVVRRSDNTVIDLGVLGGFGYWN